MKNDENNNAFLIMFLAIKKEEKISSIFFFLSIKFHEINEKWFWMKNSTISCWLRFLKGKSNEIDVNGYFEDFLCVIVLIEEIGACYVLKTKTLFVLRFEQLAINKMGWGWMIESKRKNCAL